MNFIKPLAAACLLAAACGGDDTTGTLTGDQDLAVSPDIAGAHLQSGNYNITNVTKISDECGLTLEDGTTTSLPLANTGSMLTIGNHYDSTTDPTWNPAGYGFGTGPYTSATMATLTSSAQVALTDGCTWMTTRTSNLTFVGQNNLSVDFTDNETGFTGCDANTDGTPANVTSCTSHYTFNLTM